MKLKLYHRTLLWLAALVVLMQLANMSAMLVFTKQNAQTPAFTHLATASAHVNEPLTHKYAATQGSAYGIQTLPTQSSGIPQPGQTLAQASSHPNYQKILSYLSISLAIVLATACWVARQVCDPFERLEKGIADQDETIQRLSLMDELTNLPNREHALQTLSELALEQPDNDCTLLLLGLNQYRNIIDTLGTQACDDVICALSDRLKSSFAEALLVARVSIDEFAIALPLASDPELVAYVQALITELVRPVELEHAEVLPDLSAGIVVIPDDAHTAVDIMQRASIALSDARKTHQTVCRYSEGSDEKHERSLSIVADLKRAVEDNQLTLHYQPKINMNTGCVESVEALVRWIHPRHGFMPPDEFISLAECSGYIGMLTQWVLNTAIGQVHQWHDEGIPLKVAVNLSALDLQNDSLFSSVESLLAKHHVATTRLIIEITESAMLRDAEQALATLRLMRAHGMTISIDDFGTGYSSLSKLKDLPIDELKIDRAFVTNIEPDTVESSIVKAIIDLGHSVGLTVIAEGVETQSEWDLLEKLGNDVVQGYLVSRPMTAHDMSAWWLKRYSEGATRAA